MTRDEFKKLIQKGFVFLDGATGTNLQKAGMPVGVCPEQWILENPDVMIDLQRQFVEAGSDIIYAPTFTGNRVKLKEYGFEDRLEEINTRLVEISKEAADGRALVAGDISMTGRQLYPMGDMEFEELVDIYREQALVIDKAGADLFVVETMMSLQETRAAIIAIREVSDLPALVSMTFESDGRTLFGTPPECIGPVLEGLGADCIGVNCSAGPDKMIGLVDTLYHYTSLPVMAKPNNGLPQLIEDKTVYPTTPEEFARQARALALNGARVLGGCCGSTPEHIRALKEAVRDLKPLEPLKEKKRVLCSERKLVEIVPGERFMVIGERINPTGKKALQAELREGKLDIVRRFAREQEESGADILDVNMGTSGIDEKEMMIAALEEITGVTDLPLCIDSSFPEVIEAALRRYPGRALINSISYEKEKLEALLPVARKYGAMFILLPVSDDGIPENVEKKHEILEKGLAAAFEEGFTREDIVVDALVATIGADKNAALSCLDTFAWCRERGLATVCGLSNISFGLPDRIFVNTAFLVMSVASGLTMAIANPTQDLFMNLAAASDMLLNRVGSDIRYINRINAYEERVNADPLNSLSSGSSSAGDLQISLAEGGNLQISLPDGGNIQVNLSKGEGLKNRKKTKAGDKEGSGAGNVSCNTTEGLPVYKAVLEGDKSGIVGLCKELVGQGENPGEIINTQLIPAINKVGELFEKKVYFLPQLIASANAMETAIGYLEPLIEKTGDDVKSATVVIATVEGDVHDIGKNLVALMLRNYGFDVIDMGKDVPASDIIDKAMETGAEVVGLSALMTTTMVRMKDVVELAKERGYNGKIIIGGAAVTKEYADEIGADGYSEDAADCVKLVKRLTEDM